MPSFYYSHAKEDEFVLSDPTPRSPRPQWLPISRSAAKMVVLESLADPAKNEGVRILMVEDHPRIADYLEDNDDLCVQRKQ